MFPVLVPGLLILAAALSQTSEMWSWRHQVWIHTSAKFHEEPLILAAPVAAAGAAYYAGRLTDASRIFAQPNSPRNDGQLVTRHLLTLCGFFTGAYVVGMVPMVVLTALRAPTGGPHVLVMLVGVLAVVAATSVGYTAGVLTGTAWISPLMLVLGFLAIQLNGFSQGLFLPAVPVTHGIASLGEVPNTPVLLYRIAFLVLLSTATVIVAVRSLSRPRRWKIPSLLSVGLVGALVFTILVPLSGSSPKLYADAANPPRTCRTVSGVEYCVHSGHRARLDTIVSAARAVYEQYGSVPERASRVRDASLGESTRTDGVTPARVTMHASNPPTMLTRSVQNSVAFRLVGTGACRQRYPERKQPARSGALVNSSHPADIATELAYWLLGRAEKTAELPPRFGAVPAFEGSDPQEVRAWIAEHERQIATCTLESGP
ncbi:hypothetical protein CEP50_16310 [Actinopolyspora mortivallis]|uniref:Uncharacterized protein n=1 Tax=Actinopolyspora mortivallis TaxID=33906 RepID=A0A2T0GT54_ACTMO|nr:hypothetical protein CEP50_16310 [Actinopolyspora mortivallis]